MAPAVHTQNPGIILQAQKLEYFEAENRLEATGKVSVVYGDTLLLADRLEMDTESGVGTATGDVRLSTPEDQLRASRMDFDLTNERGLVYDASGVLSNTYRVSSERLERLGPQRFVAQRGRLTTCTGRVPAWEFRARRARLGAGNHVTLQHPSFRIKGVPVFYLPYAVFPYRDERTTGFLPPHLGSDSNHGAVVRGEFFWAMTEWMDSTFGLEYFGERGYRPYVEYRYSLDPQSDGQAQGSFIHDRRTGEDLWQIFLQQRQTFGWGINGVTQLDLRSERDIQRRFARNIQQESTTHTASFASLSKRFANSRVTLQADAFEGVPDSGSDATFERLPSLHLQQFLTPLLGLVYFSVSAAADRMRASTLRDNAVVQRFDLFPQLSVPLRLAPWLQITGSAGLRQTYYQREGVAEGEVSQDYCRRARRGGRTRLAAALRAQRRRLDPPVGNGAGLPVRSRGGSGRLAGLRNPRCQRARSRSTGNTDPAGPHRPGKLRQATAVQPLLRPQRSGADTRGGPSDRRAGFSRRGRWSW